MGDEEIDYVTCMGCDTPCYIFDLGPDGKVASAFCTECGNDEPAEFAVPGQEPTGGEDTEKEKG